MKAPMTAMLRQLGPMAVIPPSPMTTAWMTREIDTAMIAGQGPSRIATRVVPEMCPVVPPGTGRTNIMAIRLKTVPMARYGISVVLTVSRTVREAYPQIGSMAAQQVP